jgi:hypothetical protein
VEWFPDATYGGFKGDICYTGVDSALCSDTTGFEDIQGRSCKDYESRYSVCLLYSYKRY